MVCSGARVLLIGAVAASGASDSDYTPPSYSDSPGAPSRGFDYQLEWQVGACVRVAGTQVELVDCSADYDGRIVKRTSSSALCPYSAEIYVEEGLTVYCIDEY